MSAIFLDGFDHYGIGQAGGQAMLNGSWAQIQGSGATGVPSFGTRTGAASLSSFANPSGRYRYVLPSALSNMFVSFGFAVDSLPTSNLSNQLCDFRDGSNTVIATVYVQSTGAIVLTNSVGAVIASTQGPVIVAANWHFIEINFNQAAGSFTLRIDDATASGTPAITYTGGTFTGAVAQMSFIFSGSGSVNSWLDDLFIRSSAGTTNNSWLGDRRVATLYANTDTTTHGWTPSYYREFGTGILTLGYIVPNNTTPQNLNAGLYAAPASSLDIGASDFTLETMVRFDQLPSASNYHSIFSRWNTRVPQLSYRLILGGSSFNNSSLQFDTTTDGTSSTLATPIVYPWAPQLNRWYHIAICRSAGELLLFVDGQQLGLPIADSRTYFSGGQEALGIGAQIDTNTIFNSVINGTTLVGRLDETRFTNGIGRYTSSFTPPVAAFPRGSSDPDWSAVTLLMGYDSSIVDESSFARTIVALNGAVSFLPSDGPTVGLFSTVNKATPDDNTFMSASLLNATNILTMTTQPSNNNTVTVGTKNGSTAAVYTFKTAISSAFDVLIDTTAQLTLTNLLNAINAGTGAGTKYGTGTTSNFDVNAILLPVGQLQVIANLAGSAGNSIPSTKSGTAMSWTTTTLTGGADIPGPTDFLLKRPPNNTTVISALQMTVRAQKTDAGSSSIQSTFVAPLGGTAAGSTHALAISPNYYTDIIEIDPDTSGPLTPTTIINGKFQINRTV